jgi:hypothetical protein
MIGTSAGAAGASAGSAGSSSETGGSGSDEAGAGATTAGGPSELGGASTGGSSELGGASTGGASTGGASTGGTSTGGTSTGGAGGGSGVGACTSNKDCAAGYNCLYKIADGCTAKGSCFKSAASGPPNGPIPGLSCQSLSSYCGCLGQTVGIPCDEPTGYSPAPVAGQKSSATCPAAPDPRCAGKSCGAQCDNGEFPAACDLDGNCTPLFMAAQCP